ncbi:MAG: type IX secretion system membrane protein PorP/SprF [Prevotella sp.]|nr:type IX secretion system membrane protein PorP/SprF [Prevotella sp.]
MWVFRLAFQHLLLCYQADKIYYCGFVVEFIKISENAIKSLLTRYLIVFRRRIILSLTLLWVSVLGIRAQYDVSFSHYFDMEPSYNPAAVGKESVLNVDLAYAMDLAGFEHNPQTMYAAADVPFYFLKSYHGGGIQFINDKLGLFNHQRISLQYSYKLPLFGGRLGIGVQAGLITEKFDGSKLDVEDSTDPALSTAELTGNQLDVCAGLYYAHKKFYVGVSALHINSPLVELGERNELQIDPTLYFTAGYNIKLRNPFLTIKPSVLLRTDLVAWRADVTGRLEYKHENKVMYGGVSYSPTNSVTVLLGGMFHGIMLGYSYEIYTSAINPGNGSHELFIGYQTDINLIKKGKNKHKSVRIL